MEMGKDHCMKRGIAILCFALAACSPSGTSPSPADSPPSFSFTLPAKWTETATATVTPTFTPTATPTSSPTDPPLPTNTDKPLTNGMGAHPSSDEELESVESIWSRVHYRELTAPGAESYATSIAADSMWQWDWWFCAAKGNFLSFINSIEIRFLLDGEPLREKEQLRVLDGSSQSGWLCRQWATVLSRWPRNRAVNLEIRWTNLTEVDDGLTDYPPGEYSQLIVVIAE
jgi:hypothetical protein